jgi:hypothetical protein
MQGSLMLKEAVNTVTTVLKGPEYTAWDRGARDAKTPKRADALNLTIRGKTWIWWELAEVADQTSNYIVERERVLGGGGEALHPLRHAASLTRNTHVEMDVTGRGHLVTGARSFDASQTQKRIQNEFI